MKIADISAELKRLLAEAKRAGVSSELEGVVDKWLDVNSRSSLTLKQAETLLTGSSAPSKTQRGARKPPKPKRDPAAVSKTIEQIVATLSATFNNDMTFEASVKEAEDSSLTKDNVVAIYNQLFRTDKKFSKSVRKPDLFNAIRRERIARVRYRS